MKPPSHDDDDWLAALAGQPREGSDALTRLEGALLRRALRDAGNTAPASDAPEPAAVESLLKRAHAEGLLQPHRSWRTRCSRCAERWRALQAWLTRRQRSGAAALVLVSLLGAVVLLPLLMPEPAEAPALRTGPEGVVLLVDAQPSARRDAIADALVAAGLVVHRYERLGRAGLDTALPPAPLPPAILQALRDAGLATPADGVLRVEVEALAP